MHAEADVVTGSVSAAVAAFGGVLESVTFTVKVDVPVAAADPVIAPEALNVNPLGRVPEARLQVYGAVPPAAERLAR